MQGSAYWNNGRKASPGQIRKAHILMKAIAEHVGEHRIEVERDLKSAFVSKVYGVPAEAAFSLAECDMTTARDFLSFLVEFVIDNGVQLDCPIAELCDDIKRTVYVSALRKRCICCCAGAELHHVTRVGMGVDRAHMNHIGMLALPLCRYHHGEAHRMGDEAFCRLNHIEPIQIDEKIAAVYDLGTGEKKRE